MPKDNSKYDLHNDYHENGQIKSEVYYLGDKREGKWTHWDENGNRVLESHFKNDKAHGTWTEWYENSQKTLEADFKDGKQDGEMTNWDVDGDLIGHRTYKDDELVWSNNSDKNLDFNILALQGGDIAMNDEEVAETTRAFPKELLHTPFMNLWLTWYHFLKNKEAEPDGSDEPFHGLSETFIRMRNIIPPKHWYQISQEYYPEYPYWWLDEDEGKLINACRFCFTKHPPRYEGFIQDDSNGYIELGELDFLGKWKVNPSDEFWLTEESIDEFYRHHSSDGTGEELFNDLLEVFGKGNLPVWADKVRDRDRDK